MGAPRPARAPDGGRGPGGIDGLIRLLREVMTPTTVIVCVGNELRGDDGAGPAVARGLAGGPAGELPWAVFDTQTAPESYVVKIAERRPASVVLVDALHLAAPPGTIQLLEPQDIAGEGPSTHGPAPTGFLEALRMMHPCRCVVLGIQPLAVEFGSALSPPVAEAVRRVIEALRRLARAVS